MLRVRCDSSRSVSASSAGVTSTSAASSCVVASRLPAADLKAAAITLGAAVILFALLLLSMPAGAQGNAFAQQGSLTTPVITTATADGWIMRKQVNEVAAARIAREQRQPQDLKRQAEEPRRHPAPEVRAERHAHLHAAPARMSRQRRARAGVPRARSAVAR